jgi:hypothetical protein
MLECHLVRQIPKTYQTMTETLQATEGTSATWEPCQRPVDTPRRRPFTAPLVATELPMDGQIPPH